MDGRGSPERTGSTQRTPAWLSLATLLAVTARIGLGWHEERRERRAVDLVAWQEPTADRETEARASGRALLYEFTADWCAPCRSLKADVFADGGRASVIREHFVPVRVDCSAGELSPAARSIKERFGVRSFPTLVVVEPDGRHRSLAGYAGPTRTMEFLRGEN